MSTSPMPEVQHQLVVDAALETVSLRAKSVAAIAALLVTIASCVAGVWLLVLLDQGVEGGLPLGVRRGIAILGGLATLAAIIYGVFVPLFRRINDLYAARLIERAHPEFHNSLITTLQLESHPDAHPGVIYGLSQAAARDVGGCNVATAVSTRPRRRGLMLLAVGVAQFGVYGLTASKSVGPSLLRVLGADLPAPTLTAVEIISPAADASVIVGTPIEFEIALRGRIPNQAVVEFSLDEGNTWLQGRRLALGDVADGRSSDVSQYRRGTLPGKDVERTLWYRGIAGDGRSPIRRLEVRPIPQIGTPTIRLTFPRYTRLEPRRRDDGQVDAVVGTQIELSVDANVPAAGASVVFHDGRGVAPRQMSIEGTDRRQLSCTWVVDRDAEFDIHFSDMFGADNPAPVRYTQRARPDQLPVVSQHSPDDDLELPPNGSFQLQAVLGDDFGLTEACIDYRVKGRSGRLPLWKDETTAPENKSIDQTLAVSAFGARAGDVIDFHLTVSDNRRDLRDQPAYQIAQGPSRRIRVVEPPRQLALNQPRGAKNRAADGSNGDPTEHADSNKEDSSDRAGSDANDSKGEPGKDGATEPKSNGEPSTSDDSGKRGRPSDDSDQDKPGTGDERDTSKSRDEPKAQKSKSDEAASSKKDAPSKEATDKPDARDSRMNNGESEGEDKNMERFVEENKEALDKLKKALGDDPKNKGGDPKTDANKDRNRQRGEAGAKPANEDPKPRDNKPRGESEEASRPENGGGPDMAGDKGGNANDKSAGKRDKTTPDRMGERQDGDRPSEPAKAGAANKDDAGDKDARESDDPNSDRSGKKDANSKGNDKDSRDGRQNGEASQDDSNQPNKKNGEQSQGADNDNKRPGELEDSRDDDQGPAGKTKPNGDSDRDGNKRDGAKDGPAGDQPGTKPGDSSKPTGEKSDGQGQPGQESQPGGAKQDSKNPPNGDGPRTNQDKPAGGQGDSEKPNSKPGEKSNPSSGEKDKPRDSHAGQGTTGSKDSPSRGRESADKGPGEGQSGDKGQGQGKDGQGKDGQGKGKGSDSKGAQGSGDGQPGDRTGEKPGSGDSGASKDAGKPAEGQKEKDKPGNGQENPKTGDAAKNDGGQNDSGGNPEGGKNGGDGAKGGDGEKPGGGSGDQPGGGMGTANKGGLRGPSPDEGPMKADSEFKGEGDGPSLDGAEMEETRRLVDELERRLRKGEVDDKMLEDLGWTEAQARKFVRDFRRRDPQAQRQTPGKRFDGREDRDTRTEPGKGVAQRAQGGRGDVKGGINADRRSNRTTEEVRERPAEDIPPEYRDLLDEYYRSMARTKKSK